MVYLVAILLLVLGLVLLIKGADIFVSASVDIAKKLNIPPVIIGLTIVAMGTSAPEIVISVTASLHGASDLAVSNVVGANSFNLMFIVGLCAFIRPMPVKLQEISKDFWISIIAAVMLLVFKLFGGGYIPLFGAIIFLAAFAAYLTMIIRKALKVRHELEGRSEKMNKPESKPRHFGHTIFLAVFGCIMIVYGGQLTVESATEIALAFGVTERVIGLTVIAIGTSLPELTTCLIACKRGENDFALGSIVGSNIFNIMFILGVSGLVSPLEIDRALVFDTAFLIAGSLVALRFAYTGKEITHREGLVLLLMYAGYMVFVLA